MHEYQMAGWMRVGGQSSAKSMKVFIFITITPKGWKTRKTNVWANKDDYLNRRWLIIYGSLRKQITIAFFPHWINDDDDNGYFCSLPLPYHMCHEYHNNNIGNYMQCWHKRKTRKECKLAKEVIFGYNNWLINVYTYTGHSHLMDDMKIVVFQFQSDSTKPHDVV